jgi:hypothetical protein
MHTVLACTPTHQLSYADCSCPSRLPSPRPFTALCPAHACAPAPAAVACPTSPIHLSSLVSLISGSYPSGPPTTFVQSEPHPPCSCAPFPKLSRPPLTPGRAMPRARACALPHVRPSPLSSRRRIVSLLASPDRAACSTCLRCATGRPPGSCARTPLPAHLDRLCLSAVHRTCAHLPCPRTRRRAHPRPYSCQLHTQSTRLCRVPPAQLSCLRVLGSLPRAARLGWPWAHPLTCHVRAARLLGFLSAGKRSGVAPSNLSPGMAVISMASMAGRFHLSHQCRRCFPSTAYHCPFLFLPHPIKRTVARAVARASVSIPIPGLPMLYNTRCRRLPP